MICELFNDGVNVRKDLFRCFNTISVNLKSSVANVVIGCDLVALVQDSA